MTPLWRETGRLGLPAGAVVPMQQHPAYAAACVALGSAVRCFEAPGLGVARVLVRSVPLLGSAALLSRGPVWVPGMPAAQRRAGLLALLTELRRRYRMVAVTPDPIDGVDPLTAAGWLRAMTPCHLARLDLSGTAADMRGRQHGKWRNRLVKAEAGDLVVRHAPMPDDPAHWLLRAEAAQARQRRYRRLPGAFTTVWVRQGGKARLFTAEIAGKPVAAMLFLLHGRAASYHIGWSGPEGRAAGAHNLLLWQAQLWLAGRGIATLDLDLIDTVTAPGLARFKLGSGARVVTLGATRLSAPGTRLFAERSRAAVPAEVAAAG